MHKLRVILCPVPSECVSSWIESKEVAADKMHSKLLYVQCAVQEFEVSQYIIKYCFMSLVQTYSDDMNNSTIRIIRASNWTKPQGKGAWAGGG